MVCMMRLNLILLTWSVLLLRIMRLLDRCVVNRLLLRVRLIGPFIEMFDLDLVMEGRIFMRMVTRYRRVVVLYGILCRKMIRYRTLHVCDLNVLVGSCIVVSRSLY